MRYMNKCSGFCKIMIAAATLCAMAALSSCGRKNPVSMSGHGSGVLPQVQGLVSYAPGDYDSEDASAVLVSQDLESQSLTFFNHAAARNYTLTYDGTTRFYDKYFGAMAPAQLSSGLVCDITFLKSTKHLNTFMVSPDAWSLTGVGRYEIDAASSSMKIGDQTYSYGKELQIFSEGKKAEMIDINPADRLSARGISHEVLSLSIDEGHGYLRLENDEYFLGGWITVADTVISRITKDMLLSVPEGKCQVHIENQGHMAEKTVSIKRNAETVLNLGDVEIEEVKEGRIIFTLNPEDAELKIDGELTDASEPVVLDYGLHRLDLSAEGYESLTRYIRVAAEGANVSLELSPVKKEEERQQGTLMPGEMSVSGNSISGNGILGSSVSGNGILGNYVSGNGGESSFLPSNPAITYITEAQTQEASDYRVRLEAPAGVEAYVDGGYVGVLPVDFAKIPGSHVITLRLEGFRTRSYTVEIDSSQKDVSFSFAALNPLGE